MIKQTDPLANYLRFKARIDSAIAGVLSSGRYILGQETEAFEREFAEYLGGGFCVGVASGTDALHLSLRAIGVGPGDEVITASHTAVPTVAAIRICGATPVMVDICEKSYTIDIKEVAKAITRKTKAVLAVHLYGQPSRLEELLALADSNGIAVIEDCAQAHGAAYRDKKVGTLGVAGAFSFYPTKNLGALGDGGAVFTKDRSLYEDILSLRQYGWDNRRISQTEGFNSRLDEIQAAVLREKLKFLDSDNKRRIAIARSYKALLEGLPLRLPREIPGTVHVFHQYVIACLDESTRNRLMAYLKRKGVQCAIHYPAPVHLHPAYSGIPRLSLPVTEKVARRILSLPMYPELQDREVDTICNAIRAFFENGMRS